MVPATCVSICVAFLIIEFMWRISMIKNYLKVALRSMKKYKAYSFINIIGLAIGMACCILILLWIQDELSYDAFHENYHQLCRTTPRFSDRASYHNPYALAPTLQGQFPEVQKIARFAWRTYLLKSGGQMFHAEGKS